MIFDTKCVIIVYDFRELLCICIMNDAFPLINLFFSPESVVNIWFIASVGYVFVGVLMFVETRHDLFTC